MADVRVQNEIFKEIDSFLEEIGEFVEGRRTMLNCIKLSPLLSHKNLKKL